MCLALAKISGSFSRTHRILGAVKPVKASLPVSSIKRVFPKRRRISSHCGPVRWSFQRMAGRKTSPASSNRVRPCICPVKPTAATSSPESPISAKTWRILLIAPCHQSAGSCSLHKGCGVERGRSVVAVSVTFPASSISNALMPVVEASIPKK